MPEVSRRARLRRDLRAAPWAAAVPLALIVIAGLTLAMVVADLGGWGEVAPGQERSYWTTYVPYGENDSLELGDSGEFGTSAAMRLNAEMNLPSVFVLLCTSLALAAALRRRWLSVVLIAALGLGLTLWVSGGQHLQYATLDSRSTTITAITLSAVIGLLLAAGAVAALAWAVTGRRWSPSPRPPWRRLVAGAVVWVGAVLVAPAGTRPADGSDVLVADSGLYGTTQMLLLLITIAVVYATALLLRRARPALALAATIIGAALWGPLIWMTDAFGLFSVMPGTDTALGWLVPWALLLAVGVAGGAGVVAATGRGQRSRLATAPERSAG